MPLNVLTNDTTASKETEDNVSLSQLIHSKLPKCRVCHKNVTEPKYLTCSHTFCKDCITSQVSSFAGSDAVELKCPVCDTSVKLEKSVDELKDDLLLKYVSKEFANFEANAIVCNGCEVGNRAVVACIDCSHYLCEGCFNAHEAVKYNKDNHKCFDLNLVKNLEAFKEFQKHKFPVCDVHKEKKKLFCLDDKSEICHVCHCSAEHKHHSVIPIQEQINSIMVTIDHDRNILLKKKHEVQEARTELEKKLASCQDKIQVSLDYIKQKEEEAKMQIEEKFNVFRKRLREDSATIVDGYKEKIRVNERVLQKVEWSTWKEEMLFMLPTSAKLEVCTSYLDNLGKQRLEADDFIKAKESEMVQEMHEIPDIKIERYINVNLYIDEKKAVFYKNGISVAVGDRVKRGPDWKSLSRIKEGGPDSTGVITEILDDVEHDVRVYWGVGDTVRFALGVNTGNSRRHALGANSKYELEYVSSGKKRCTIS